MTTPTKFRITTAVFLLFGLAGCSGGGGNGAAGPVAVPDEVPEANERPVDLASRARMNNDLSGMLNVYRPSAITSWEDSGDRPRSGTGTYNGIAGFNSDASTGGRSSEIVANMAMTLYFGSDDVNGAMWNFHDTDGTQAGGSVQLTGRLGHSGPGGPQGEAGAYRDSIVRVNGAGTLDWGDHDQELDIGMSGFILEGADAVGGTIYGTSTIDGDQTDILGDAVLERDTLSNPVQR
ncbi:hypothetical protein [Oceaniglobus indicus]|uniref:hypothetical protein n=1 Tax=Oceaniglobus indicus TaxID=2047749 RepID=UPI000C1765F1|nr:hypothetical protein [Oceaniglobus indicus]